MSHLFHISGWKYLKSVQPGDTFTLFPGKQNAEGIGVYFSEGEPRAVSCAEGTRESGVAAIICIEAAQSDASWWRSKGIKARKTGKARTWHSDGKALLCTVNKIDGQCVYCSWSFCEVK